MKERPITFTRAEVFAIRDGRKTQFRRVVKWPLLSKSDGSKRRMLVEKDAGLLSEILRENTRSHPHLQFCPYGQPGDRLWVRELWSPYGTKAIYRADTTPSVTEMLKRAGHTGIGSWTPAVQMPRKHSRFWLENQSVRVERLQDITEDGATAEGDDPLSWFAHCWRKSWAANPWVWVVAFRVVEGGRND